MPLALCRYRTLVIAVLGAEPAERRRYVATLVERLRSDVGPRLGFVLEALDEATWRHRRADPASDDPEPQPLLYSLTFTTAGRSGRRRIRRVVALTLLEVADADLEPSPEETPIQRLLRRADGAVVLASPRGLDGVRVRLAAADLLEDDELPADDGAAVLERLTHRIGEGRRLDVGRKLSLPLAVTVCELDRVASILDPQSQLHTEPDHDGGFDVRDFEAVSAETEDLLEDWGGRALVELARTRYRRHAFFATSLRGRCLDGSEPTPATAPWRIEDPWLWLLAVHGLVPKVDR